mgnify:CR=1 FL=1
MAMLKTWEKYVKTGKCSLFEEWAAYTGVTEKDFLDGLDWLFKDSRDDKFASGKPTRELVCTLDGRLHHYRRLYYDDGSFKDFVPFEGTGLKRTGLPQRVVRMNVDDPLDACTETQRATILEEAKARKKAAQIWELKK